MAGISVLLADPGGDIRDALRDGMSGEDGFEIAAVAEDGREALRLINELRPAVAVTDLVMPSLDGLGLLEKVAAPTKIIIVSAFFHDVIVSRCAALGASYFMPKPCDSASLRLRIAQAAGEDAARYSPLGAEAEISNRLLDLGISPNLKGYAYLREAVIMAAGSAGAITKEIYPDVAKKFGTKPARVERAIRGAIETAWQTATPEALRLSPRRPTNYALVALLAESIRLGRR